MSTVHKEIGQLLVKKDTEKVTEKFQKREFVIETLNEVKEHRQKVLFQITQDRVSKLDDLNLGDKIEVSFNLKGRDWENPESKEIKYFNSLDCFNLKKVD